MAKISALRRQVERLGLDRPHIRLTRVLESDLAFRPYDFVSGVMRPAEPKMLRRRSPPLCARLFRQMRAHWARTGLGRVARLLRRAEQAVADAPRDAEPRRLAGLLKLLSNRPEEAITEFEEALRLEPAWPEGPGLLGEARLQLGDPEGALPHLKRATQRDGADAWAWVWRATAEEGSGLKAAAKRSLRRAEALAPRSSEIQVLLGRDSTAALEKAVRLSPASFWPRVFRARDRDRRRDYLGAVEDWNAALRLDARCPWAYVLRAWTRRRAGDEQGFFRDMAAAVDLEPGCIIGFTREVGARGSLPYHPFGAPTEWIARQLGILRREHKSGPKAWIHSIIADYRFSYEVALPDIQKGLDHEPNNYLLWAFRARALGALGRRRLPAMRAAMDRALELAPRVGWLYAWRAEIRKRTGDPRGALRDLSRAVRFDPIYPINFCWRGSNRRALGDLRGALRDQDRALDLIRELGEDYDFLFGERKSVLCALGRPLAAVREYSEKACASSSFPWASVDGAAAAAELRRLRARYPRETRINAVLSDVLLRAGRFKEAVAAANLALTTAPPCALAHGVRAEALFRLGRFKEALADADAAVALRPLSPRFYSARVNILLALCRSREAIADIDRLLVLMWRTEGYYILRARLRRRNGQARRARAELDALLRVNPRSPWARYERAQCALALGEPASDWQRDLRMAVLTEDLRCGTKHAYLTLDFETAIAEDFERACAEGGRGRAFAVRGVLRAGRGETAAAEADMAEAVRSDRRCAWVNAWRAEQRLKEGRPEEAQRLLAAARPAAPRMGWVRGLNGRALLELGRFTSARRDLSRAVELDPTLWQSYTDRAWIRRRANDYHGAVADLDRALAIDARHAWVHGWRGEALLRLGLPSMAVGALDEALALHEDYRDARLWRTAAARTLRAAAKLEAAGARASA